jgi:hypothetical protein
MQPIVLHELLLALAPMLAQGTTHYVDDEQQCSGSPCYATIQAAIDAASAGDTILIDAGDYAGFTVSGKHLTIQSNNAAVNVFGTVTVTYVPESESMSTLISELNIFGGEGATPGTNSGVYLADNLGNVSLQGCLIVGGREPQAAPNCPIGRAGVYVKDCGFAGLHGVSLTDCEISGGWRDEGECVDGDGGDGLVAMGGEVTQIELDGTFVAGGRGTTNALADGSDAGEGGSGLHSLGVLTLIATGCSFEGGDGGDNHASHGRYGNGGPGVFEEGESTTAGFVDSVVSGGLAGQQAWGRRGGLCAAWLPESNQGATFQPGRNGRQLHTRSLIAGWRDVIEVHVTGYPGDRVEVLIADQLAPFDSSQGNRRRVGPSLVRSSLQDEGLRVEPLANAGTSVKQSIPLEGLRKSDRAVTFFVQARITTGEGRVVWSAPRAVVVLPVEMAVKK